MSPSAFDLNLLLVLDAVLAEGSVAKATSRLHVIPSAVSNALARLRVLFGDPLLTRKGRGIVPTPRALELTAVLAGLAYQRAGIARDVVVTVPTFSAAAAVVAATDFVATVPISLYVAMGHAMRLGTLPLPVPEMTIATNMCWHERTHADATAAGFAILFGKP